VEELVLSVSDFVAVFNQTLTYAYPTVTIEGELANFKIAKNRWLYFDLKDEGAKINFFGTVQHLPGPLDDGLLLRVKGIPVLHPQFGFNINVQYMQPIGSGSIKKAAQLLAAKLTAEGLFDEARKRPIAYPPSRIGLISSVESAAYHDFIKILGQRWGGIDIEICDVQVQGEQSPAQIVEALSYFNSQSNPVDLIVITRGGGSADDLVAFDHEMVVRAVSTSRIPTLVAIGHEVDISLAERAADRRASTPTHAAELISPNKKDILADLIKLEERLNLLVSSNIEDARSDIANLSTNLSENWQTYHKHQLDNLVQTRQLLESLSPAGTLKRGYAIVRKSGKALKSGSSVSGGDILDIQLQDAEIKSQVKTVNIG
jgi:exodeoxyribonuclease VII large subunit